MLLLLLSCADPDCRPGNELVELLDELSAGQVLEVVEAWELRGPEAISCEMMCLATYQAERGWEWMEIDTCTFDLDYVAYDASIANGNTEAPVGQVACTGEGIEYLCE